MSRNDAKGQISERPSQLHRRQSQESQSAVKRLFLLESPIVEHLSKMFMGWHQAPTRSQAPAWERTLCKLRFPDSVTDQIVRGGLSAAMQMYRCSKRSASKLSFEDRVPKPELGNERHRGDDRAVRGGAEQLFHRRYD